MKTKTKGRKFLSTLLALCMMFGLCVGFGTTAMADSTVTPMVVHTRNNNYALAADGTVWAWGINGSGQLGNGSTIASSTPVRVQGLDGKRIISISGGSGYALALAADGTVWGWGNNGSKQISPDLSGDQATPVQIPHLSGKNVVALDIGQEGSYSFALDSDGTITRWGGGFYAKPTYSLESQGRKIVRFSGTASNIIALANDGTLWINGVNGGGQYGNGTTEGGGDSFKQMIGMGNVQFTNFEADHFHSPYGSNDFATISVLDTEGNVWISGHNTHYQLGAGNIDNQQIINSTKIESLSNIVSIKMQNSCALAMDKNGDFWTWGRRVLSWPDLDLTDAEVITIPTKFPEVSGQSVEQYDFQIFMKSDGSVWTFGTNSYGQLGNGTTTDSTNALVQVVGENGEGFLNLKAVPDTPVDERDATISATATIPSPSYTVTIPSTVDAGALTQKTSSDTEKIKAKEFTVSATSVENLFGTKKIVVTLSTADGKFELADGDHKLAYSVFNKQSGGSALASGADFTQFTDAGNKTGRIEIDQSTITRKGSYTGTMTFTISLADVTA